MLSANLWYYKSITYRINLPDYQPFKFLDNTNIHHEK